MHKFNKSYILVPLIMVLSCMGIVFYENSVKNTANSSVTASQSSVVIGDKVLQKKEISKYTKKEKREYHNFVSSLIAWLFFGVVFSVLHSIWRGYFFQLDEFYK